LQYTAIGEAVNLASRVEGMNKVYGTTILATQAVVDGAGNGFVFREVDLVAPAGTTRPVALYELLGEAGQVDAALLADVAAWSEALAAYRRRDWTGAAAGFAALRDGPAGPVLVSLYLDRCAAFASVPPPDDWDGVAVMHRK
jgi:adenylate cyclase